MSSTEAATQVPATADKQSSLYRWYVLGTLCVIYVLATVDRMVVSVVAEPIRNEFGLSDSQLGLLAGFAFSISFALASMPMGYLIDRFSRKAILGCALSIWSLLTAVCSIVHHYWLLVLARVGVGAAESGVVPCCLSIIADTFSPKKRTTAVGIFYSATALGLVIVFLLGGFLLGVYGWRSVFLVAGVPGLLLAFLVFFTFKEPKRGNFDEPAEQPQKFNFFTVFKVVVKDRALLLIILANTIATGVHYSFTTWMTSFVTRIHEVPIDKAAIMNGLTMGVAMGIGSLITGWSTDRFSRGNQARLALVAAFTSFMAMLGGLIFANAPSLYMTMFGLGVVGLFMGGYLSAGYTLMLNLAQPYIRASTISLGKLSMMLLGQGFTPLFTGMLSDALGGEQAISPALTGTLLLYTLVVIAFLITMRNPRLHQRSISGVP